MLDDFQDVLPIHLARVCELRATVLRPGLGPLKSVHQVRAKLRKNGDNSNTAVGMVLRLACVNCEARLLPVDIFPFQAGHLRWTSQPPKTTQCEYQPPLRIGAGLQNGLRFRHADKVEPFRILTDRSRLAFKRILGDELLSNRSPEERFGEFRPDAIISKLEITVSRRLNEW